MNVSVVVPSSFEFSSHSDSSRIVAEYIHPLRGLSFTTFSSTMKVEWSYKLFSVDHKNNFQRYRSNHVGS